ncbi:MAG: hypothetical protein KAR20_02680 [Candidatus Heimdallarchaeota archaeon]|nr:hypothetical protein [Candidatus Heimdallarchaeota archaeon]
MRKNFRLLTGTSKECETDLNEINKIHFIEIINMVDRGHNGITILLTVEKRDPNWPAPPDPQINV